MTHTPTPEQPEALRAIRALREYIEAIPKDVADNLPAMPGVDGDWIDSVEGNLEAASVLEVERKLPTLQELQECLRKGALVTNGDAWTLAEQVQELLAAPQPNGEAA